MFFTKKSIHFQFNNPYFLHYITLTLRFATNQSQNNLYLHFLRIHIYQFLQLGFSVIVHHNFVHIATIQNF